MSVVFDKLSFVKRLEDAGTFSRPQAETLSDAFHQAVSETVATKQDVTAIRTDMAQLGSDLRHEMAQLGSDLRHDIAGLGTELRHEISQTRIESQHEASILRSELKAGLAETRVWTVSIGATIVAVLAAMKYFG